MRHRHPTTDVVEPRDGRDILLIVADEPLCGLLLELADINGYDAFACETPLDTIDTLVDVGHRVACAILSSTAHWADGIEPFLAEEYPHIERIVVGNRAATDHDVRRAQLEAVACVRRFERLGPDVSR